MILITKYIDDLVKDGVTKNKDIAEILGVSSSMISAYRTGSYKPSLDVGIRLYHTQGIVIHPYAEESLIYEAKLWDMS